MSMVSSHPSSVSRLRQAALAAALCSSVLWTTAAVAGPLSIALPGERAFPESITSARDGSLFVGRLGEGGIVRVDPRTGAAAVFVAPGAAGSRSITGVFADDASGTLWACSNDLSALGGPSEGRDRGAALKAFDLRTGAAKRSMPLPEPHPFCNDIAVDAGGAVYVTDSANPTVLRLPAGASGFEVFATNPQFSPPQPNSAGLDGIAFGGDGALYVTTYAAGGFFRIAVDKGRAGRVIKLQGQALGLPDGLRALGRNSFLLVEGAGTLDRVEVDGDGDGFRVAPLRAGFRTPTSVTRVGSVAWVSEGQMPLFFDPARKGESPALPFRIYAVSLYKGKSQ
jgi:sugar lactone lactonase YvrE